MREVDLTESVPSISEILSDIKEIDPHYYSWIIEQIRLGEQEALLDEDEE